MSGEPAYGGSLGVGFHEAGHAVIGWERGLAIAQLTLQRVGWLSGEAQAGFTEVRTGWGQEDLVPPGGGEDELRAALVFLAAGRVAHERYLTEVAGWPASRAAREVAGGSEGDAGHARALAASYPQWEVSPRWAETTADAAVERSWSRIEEVARRLAASPSHRLAGRAAR